MTENKKDQEEENQEIEINPEDHNKTSEEIEIEYEDIDQVEASDADLIKDLEDQLLRAKAEVQNVRRIAAQEVTKARLMESNL